MQTRPIVLVGLALGALAGCQSYFPNGYNGAGPYSAFPQGGYGPPPTVTSPPTTFQPGRTPPAGQITTETPSAPNKYQPAQGLNSVPNPREPGSAPATLGTPNDELGEETIRRGTSNRTPPPAKFSGLTDESEEMLSALGDEDFHTPKSIRSASAIDDGDDMPSAATKKRPNPYKYDREGHSWLRGTVSRDKEGRWRLRYSENALDDDDPYGGALEIVGDEKIEQLLEDDVIYVKGRVDPSIKDAFGKPSYRVDSLDILKPKIK